MKSRVLLNLLLAGAIAGVAVALYFKSQREVNDVPASYALIAGSLQTIQHIEVRRAHGPIISLEREGARWRMRQPFAARLDDVQLSRVLDVARLRASVRLPATDLARFDLDKPWAQIMFDQHKLEFGATNSITHELYVRNGEQIYAVPPRLAAAIPGDVAKWLAHRLLADNEHPVTFEFERFSIRHDGVRWLIGPDDPGLSQDDLLRWVEQWRTASSIVTQPAGSAASSDFVTIVLRDARKIPVQVIARTPDLVLLRRDEHLLYHLPASLAAQLLVPPNAAASVAR